MTRNLKKPLLAAVLVLMMAFAVMAGISSAQTVATNTQPTFGNPASYGDLNQYTWTSPRGDPSNTGFSPGPAPNTPDVAWNFSARGLSGSIAIFNGMAFAESSNMLYAVNAFTGELVWTAPLNGTQGVARVGPTQIDKDYLLVDTGHSFQCHRITDGKFMWAVPNFYTGTNVSDLNPGGSNGGLLPGGPNYMAGAYSPELKMKYVVGYNGMTNVIYAYDLSNPSQLPPIAWQYTSSDGGSEILCFGDGKLFVGGDAYRVYALDGKTGKLLWMSPKVGYAGQMGVYSEGKVYVAGDSATLACYDANNGTLIWDYYAGDRAFFAYAGTAAYGRYYEHNDQLVPSSFFACWDSKTGNMLWQQPAAYFIGYLAPVSADGKIFTSTSDGQGTTDQAAVPATFTCFDAFSGQKLWDVRLNIAFPAIAYGNVYGISGGTLYCIGSPQSWSMWRGNLNAPGVGQSATTNLTTPLWTYKTGAAVTSSPAVADGKIYVGSQDKNVYCLDAYTGNKVWNYTTGTLVLSSPAVYNGYVYTGADDGYIHCLNAATGAQLWQTNAGGIVPVVFSPVWQPRSSPIIAEGQLYVGALDGKVYCLNPATGAIQWTYATANPIGGSPTYSKGVVYIASTDTYLYALNATNGNLIWKAQAPEPVRTAAFNLFFVGSPVVGGDKVFIGGGGGGSGTLPRATLAAFNVNNGSLAWKISLDGTTWAVFTPTYVNGVLYVDSSLYVAAVNATNGTFIWKQWLGFTSTSSVAYANNLNGPTVYVGCDAFSVKCFNATDGKPFSAYTTKSQIVSSVALWEGKVYIGSSDGSMYAFGDIARESTSITASASKTQTNAGEAVTVTGQLNPKLPNTTVTISFTQPDQTTRSVDATTDNLGAFTASYTPTTAGNWTITASYAGKQYPAYTYQASASPVIILAVQGTTTNPTATPQTTTTPIPTAVATTTPSNTIAPQPSATPTATNAPSATASSAPQTGASALDQTYLIVAAAIIIIGIAITAAVLLRRR